MHDPRSPVTTTVEPLPAAPVASAPASIEHTAAPHSSATGAPPCIGPPVDAPVDEQSAVSLDPLPAADAGSALWIGFIAGLALLLAGFIWLALIAVPPGG